MEADDLQAQSETPDQSLAAGERRIADRLDAIEAERVMQRALALEAASLDQPHVITTEQLERIAHEIGVDQAFVRQALGEVRLEAEPRSRISRWILPDDLLETGTISGLERADADAAIKKWMTQNEGLTPGHILADGIEWDVDRRWRARMLSRSLSGSNRISRIAGGDVTHRVHSTSDQEHVVALSSTGRYPLVFAHLVTAVGSALAVVGAAATGELVNGLAFFGSFAALSAGIGVGGARFWARGIGAAMRRSLIGLVGSAKPKRKPWFSRGRTRLRRKN